MIDSNESVKGEATEGSPRGGGDSQEEPRDVQAEARRFVDAVPLPGGGGPTIACPAKGCGREFAIWVHLKLHIGSDHEGPVPVQVACPFCSAKPEAWMWRKHLGSHHPLQVLKKPASFFADSFSVL